MVDNYILGSEILESKPFANCPSVRAQKDSRTHLQIQLFSFFFFAMETGRSCSTNILPTTDGSFVIYWITETLNQTPKTKHACYLQRDT